MSTRDLGTGASKRAASAVSNASGGGIHIKPSHKGLLHRDLGIQADKPIPTEKLQSKPGDSPAEAKRKNFARNARNWNH